VSLVEGATKRECMLCIVDVAIVFIVWLLVNQRWVVFIGILYESMLGL